MSHCCERSQRLPRCDWGVYQIGRLEGVTANVKEAGRGRAETATGSRHRMGDQYHFWKVRRTDRLITSKSFTRTRASLDVAFVIAPRWRNPANSDFLIPGVICTGHLQDRYTAATIPDDHLQGRLGNSSWTRYVVNNPFLDIR